MVSGFQPPTTRSTVLLEGPYATPATAPRSASVTSTAPTLSNWCSDHSGRGASTRGRVRQAAVAQIVGSATALAPPPHRPRQVSRTVSAINVAQPALSQSCATGTSWAICSAPDCRDRRPVRDAGLARWLQGLGAPANPSSPPERGRRSVIPEESKRVSPAHQADFAATAAAGQRHGDRRLGAVPGASKPSRVVACSAH